MLDVQSSYGDSESSGHDDQLEWAFNESVIFVRILILIALFLVLVENLAAQRDDPT